MLGLTPSYNNEVTTDPIHLKNKLFEDIEDLVTNIFHEDDKIKDAIDSSFTLYYFHRLKHSFGDTFVLDHKCIHRLRSLLSRWSQQCPYESPPLSLDDANRLIKLVSEVTSSAEPISLKTLAYSDSAKSHAKANSSNTVNSGSDTSAPLYSEKLVNEFDNALSILCLGLEAVVFSHLYCEFQLFR